MSEISQIQRRSSIIQPRETSKMQKTFKRKPTAAMTDRWIRRVSVTNDQSRTMFDQQKPKWYSHWKFNDLVLKVLPEAFAKKWFIANDRMDAMEFQWKRPYHYFLALLACTLSLSDLTRFPYYCFHYGGILFVLMHIFFLIIMAFPLFFLENMLGQYTGDPVVTIINNICPAAGGFGYDIVLTRMIELTEVSIKLSWIFEYMFSAMSPEIPWNICGRESKSEFCSTYSNVKRNETGAEFMAYIKGLDLTKDPDWMYIICNYSMVWMMFYICIRRGLKSTVQVSHVTVVIALLSLIVLCFATFLAKGGMDGIHHFLFTKTDHVISAEAVLYAMKTSLDTYSLGYAVNFMFGKYNDYSCNFLNVVTIVAVIDLVFQLTVTFTVAAFIGMGVSYENGNLSETDLVFDDKEATSLLLHRAPKVFLYFGDGMHFWAVLFYVFCVAISIDLGFVMLETIMHSWLSVSVRLKQNESLVRMMLCLSQWCFGMLFFLPYGIEIRANMIDLNILDSEMLFVFEVVLITWVYGFGSSLKRRHFGDLKEMIGWYPRYYYYLNLCFYFSSPVLIIVYTFARMFYTYSENFPADPTPSHLVIYIVVLLRSPIILFVYAVNRMVYAHRHNRSIRKLFIPNLDRMSLRVSNNGKYH